MTLGDFLQSMQRENSLPHCARNADVLASRSFMSLAVDSTSPLDNRQLFSSAYLRDLQNQNSSAQASDALKAAWATIRDWRAEYPHLSDSSSLNAYVRYVLSALDVAATSATASGAQTGVYTIFSDADKKTPTGLCLLVADEDLGCTLKGRHYQQQLVSALRQHDLGWGLLTNGKHWRLGRADAAAPYEEWLQFDVDALLRAPLEQFGVLAALCGGAAWRLDENGALGLDAQLAQSDKRTQSVERHLKNRVEAITSNLCLGFVATENGEVADYSRQQLDDIYRNATYLLYRILFVFYAEARGLLPLDNAAYEPHSLKNIVARAARRQTEGAPEADPFSLYLTLRDLFGAVDVGNENWQVPAYNGGLFSDVEKPYLRDHLIRDEFLAPALFDLAYETGGGAPRLIDYEDLSVRHLGTLYEGLLEYKLNLVTREPVVVRDLKGKRQYVRQSEAGAIKKGETVLEIGAVYFADDKGERKSSGSYYTPEDVVQYIVAQTLAPQLEARRAALQSTLERVRAERAVAANDDEAARLERYADSQLLNCVDKQILELKILDPAMGSGHFLVAAGQRVADFVVETFALTDWENEEIGCEPLEWKRRVVERCLYGVDVNPLAQELAKLSLWIESASRGKPLTFLDHHLKVGDSLLGAPLSHLAQWPAAKTKALLGAATPPANLFSAERDRALGELLQAMAPLTHSDSQTINDSKDKARINKRIGVLTTRWRDAANLWLYGAADGRAQSQDDWDKLLGQMKLNATKDEEEAWEDFVGKSEPLQAARAAAERGGYFHWELEFPDAVADGVCRFDCIIANPPYVGTKADRAIQTLYQTAPCGDLYAWIFERGLQMLAPSGSLGTIVPMSLVFAGNKKTLRKALMNTSAEIKLAAFDNNPDAIFQAPGVARNSQRATIATLRGLDSSSRIFATDCLRWSRVERNVLFESLKFAEISHIATERYFPCVGNPLLAEFLYEISNCGRTIADLTSNEGKYFLCVPSAARYFIAAVPVDLERRNQEMLFFDNEDSRNIAFALLNSNVFFWYWRARSDGFWVAREHIISMPIPKLDKERNDLLDLAQLLWEQASESGVTQKWNGKLVTTYYFNRHMDILLEIDDWIVKHVAPDLELPRDIFAQYKSNSFLRPLDLSALGVEAGEDA